MNVFVTGGGGFIGRHLIPRLLPDHNVVAHHNRGLERPLESMARTVVGEIESMDKETILRLFSGEPFALIHLAWHSPREGRYSVAARHVAQMAHLLEVSQGISPCVISLGSADEYGTREGKLAPGTASEGTLSPYGWGKKCARELLANHSANTGIAGFWLRPFTVYGENQRGNMLLPYAVSEARAGREACFTDGLQERDFVHVEDVVDAILLALNRSCVGFHAVNIGWGKPVQVKRVLLEIARQFNAEHLFKIGAIPRRPDEPMVRFADVDEAETLLHWKPKVDLDEGLRRITTHDESRNGVSSSPAPLQKAARG